MAGSSTSYQLIHKLSAAFMLLALIWLTISIPFVYKAQQDLAKQEVAKMSLDVDDDQSDNDDNPFANTNEEKSGNSLTPTEEFLHDHHHEMKHHFTEISAQLIHEHESTYIAFHGELLCPPPNA